MRKAIPRTPERVFSVQGVYGFHRVAVYRRATASPQRRRDSSAHVLSVTKIRVPLRSVSTAICAPWSDTGSSCQPRMHQNHQRQDPRTCGTLEPGMPVIVLPKKRPGRKPKRGCICSLFPNRTPNMQFPSLKKTLESSEDPIPDKETVGIKIRVTVLRPTLFCWIRQPEIRNLFRLKSLIPQ